MNGLTWIRMLIQDLLWIGIVPRFELNQAMDHRAC